MSEGTEASVGSKRRSRFSSLDNAPDSQKDQNSAASLREQEDLIIQKELEESQNNAKKQRTISMKDTIDLAFSHPSAQDAIQAAAARAAEISKELNSKIALVSSILMHNSAPTSNSERKAAYRPLLLDKLGREIDEQGNVVKMDQRVKTLAANAAIEAAQKKKENPYLAHKAIVPGNASVVPGLANVPGMAGLIPEVVSDDRLPVAPRRDLRAKKGLKFVEAGKYVQEADSLRKKEERKLIAGYSSGRKTLEKSAADDDDVEGGIEGDDSGDKQPEPIHTLPLKSQAILSVPPLPDGGAPAVEWWDEFFLPREKRELRKVSRGAQEQDDYPLAAISNCKFLKLIQHPIPVRPPGSTGDRPTPALPMFLTKQERKKIRKTTRQEREQEKRDKLMMGLIAAPEPKFKLSNFMKVLGEQAVADPSRVEMKVLQQMQQRVLNHEMRNQAAKLTPQERKEKKTKKLHEDAAKPGQLQSAAFSVKDFANLKHRFKVDVNAQQYFLTGIVLLCPTERLNLVVVEGGPKGIRKFTRLMLNRIPWHEAGNNSDEFESGQGDAVEGDEDSDDDDEPVHTRKESDQMNQGEDGDDSLRNPNPNRCDLLWSGALARRLFTGFKFTESRNSAAAKKLLDGKGAGYFWELAQRIDDIRDSAKIL